MTKLMTACALFALLTFAVTACDDGDGNGTPDADVGSEVDDDIAAEAEVSADADTDVPVEAVDDADVPVEAVEDADVTEEADVDAVEDADVTEEAEADVVVPACDQPGAWFDTTSSLCWEDEPPSDRISITAGEAYCAGLDTAGYAWRLPTVDELRSLLRTEGCSESCDCEANLPGGACGLTAVGSVCLDYPSCRAACGVCSVGEGPGADGCYWPADIGGSCGGYWSANAATDVAGQQWMGVFDYGDFTCRPTDMWTAMVRCVRDDS